MTSGYESTIWNYFIGKIGNEFGVAGLMGNLYAESGLYPNNLQNTFNESLGMTDQEYTRGVDTGSYTNFINDGAGYGLAQWTYSSRKLGLYNLWEYGVSLGIYSSISNIELQCEYLWWELENDFPGVLKILKEAKSIREASNSVLHDFENPKVQTTAVEVQREKYSIIYYELYVGSYDGGSDPSVTTKNKRKHYNFTLFNHRRRKQWTKGQMH